MWFVWVSHIEFLCVNFGKLYQDCSIFLLFSMPIFSILGHLFSFWFFFFPFWTLSLLPNWCVEISKKKKNLPCCCQIIVKYLSTQQKSWVEENAARLLSLLTTNVVYCVAPSQTLHHLADPWLAPKSDEKFNKRPMFWTKQRIMLWEESFCKIQQVKGNVGENQAKHFTMTITKNRFYSSFTDIIIYQSNLVYTYTHASP